MRIGKGWYFDGVEFPMIRPKDIPVGMVSVPVVIQDFATELVHHTTMTASSAGVTVRVLDAETGGSIISASFGLVHVGGVGAGFWGMGGGEAINVLASNIFCLNLQ